MLSKDTMLKLAKKAVVKSANNDWKGRGKLTLVGKLKTQPLFYDAQRHIGQSTAAYFKFEHPLERQSFSYKDAPFIGFTLVALNLGHKVIYDTHPVIGKLDKDDFGFNALVNRFCPECLSLDSITTKERQVAPECIEITYKCKYCSYVEYDVMD
jgi:hypothetical protein